MKHYLKNNEIFAFEDDGTQDHLITEDMVALSDEELTELRKPTEAKILENKIIEAKAYLLATDYVTAKYNDEVTVTGSMTKAAFLAKYSDVYAQRAEARAIINMGEA